MMVEMVVVFLGESVHKNYKMQNIWCNLKDTFGFLRSLLQILMKLVEGPQLPRHDNRDTVDGQEWIIVHMSIPLRKTQTGS